MVSSANHPPAQPSNHLWAWVLLLAVHAWLTLGWFGEDGWQALRDDRPVIGGRHALHLYQAYLGAHALLDHGRTACYDPFCYAGYPKTAWLDGAARPAELFLLPAGGRFDPAAYKVGLAVTWVLLPLTPAVWALVAGRPRALPLAFLAGLALVWSRWGQAMFRTGDLDLLVAAGLLVLLLAALTGFHRWPGAVTLVLVTGVNLTILACQPLLVGGSLALGLTFWAVTGGRHKWPWHLALMLAGGTAMATAWPFFNELSGYWWTLADSPNRTGLPSAVARFNSQWMVFTGLLTVAAPLMDVGQWLLDRLGARVGRGLSPVVWAALGWLVLAPQRELVPLPVGLTVEQTAVLEALAEQTGPHARILWEEGPQVDDWSPLLPVLTQRAYLGPLGQYARIDHAALRLDRYVLAGRPLDQWTPPELAEYARRYNVGWVVCTDPQPFLKAFPGAGAAPLANGSTLVTLPTPGGFVLQGSARVVECDDRHLTLTDLEPEGGVVVLSFHHHPRIQPSATGVTVERDLQIDDPVPFLRLRLAGPLARLTLYWNE